LSPKNGPLEQHPGPGKDGQNNTKTSVLVTFLPENLKPKTKNVFFSMSTRRLAESVEGLNSSLVLAAGDLWPKKGAPICCRAVVLNDCDDSWPTTTFFVQSQQNSYLSRGSEFGYYDMGCVGTPPNSDAFLSVLTDYFVRLWRQLQV